MKKSLFIGFILAAIVIPMTITAASINNSEELNEAISWLYTNGLTKYSDSSSFKATNYIRRDESSKFFVLFTRNILNKFGKVSSENSTSLSCTAFIDVDKKNTMKEYITSACNLGAIKGSNGKFKPNASLTNAQAVAIVMRMINGDLEEPKNDRSANYYEAANESNLLENLSLSNKKGAVTRGDLAILLYRVNTLYEEYAKLAQVFSNTGNTNTGGTGK